MSLRRRTGDYAGRLPAEALPRFEAKLHGQLLERRLTGTELWAAVRALRVWPLDAPLPRLRALLDARLEAWLAEPGSPPLVVLGPLSDMLAELTRRASYTVPPYRPYEAAAAYLGGVDWGALDARGYEREAGKRAGKLLHAYAVGGPARVPFAPPPPAAVVGLARLAAGSAAVAATPAEAAVRLLDNIGELTQRLSEACEAELAGAGTPTAGGPSAGERAGDAAAGPRMHGAVDGGAAGDGSDPHSRGTLAEGLGGSTAAGQGAAEGNLDADGHAEDADGPGEQAPAGPGAAEGGPEPDGADAEGSGEDAEGPCPRAPNPVRAIITDGLAGRLDALVLRALQALRSGPDAPAGDAAVRAEVLYRLTCALRRLHYDPGDGPAADLAGAVPPLAAHLCDKGVRAVSELLRAWALHRARTPAREVTLLPLYLVDSEEPLTSFWRMFRCCARCCCDAAQHQGERGRQCRCWMRWPTASWTCASAGAGTSAARAGCGTSWGSRARGGRPGAVPSLAASSDRRARLRRHPHCLQSVLGVHALWLGCS